MPRLPLQPIRRRPATLTDTALEHEILNSTPKGRVEGRELSVDFSELAHADFHTVGRLIGWCEGFARRGGHIRIVQPPPRATVAEAQQLSQVTVQPTFERNQENLARLVQDRSRASRFLQRVGFLDAARCEHLQPASVGIDAMPPLATERGQAGARVLPSPLSDQAQLLEVLPFRWLPMTGQEEFQAAIRRIDLLLSRVEVDRRIRQAIHELAQNVWEHSLHGDDVMASIASQHMLFGVATRDTDNGVLLEILVVDGGVGIPETLGPAFHAANGRTGTQSEIVAYAFDANSTRKEKAQVEGSARGLAVVLRAVRNAGGTMLVRSGTGEVLLDAGELVTRDIRDGFQPGTSFSLSIPFERAQYRPSELDTARIDPGALDVEAYVVDRGGKSELLVSLGPAKGPALQEPTVIFVVPGCTRAELEQALDDNIKPQSLLIIGPADGQGSLLRDQVEAIVAARPPTAGATILVFDGLEPVLVQGSIEQPTARGLVRSVIERLASFLTDTVATVVDHTPIDPRRTWSLEIAARWIEPSQLAEPTSIRVLTPLILAFRAALAIAENTSSNLTILDIIVTDKEFTRAAEAMAGWLGARHVRPIRIPQEPDSALLADEIEAASVVLTPVIHGGGATVPIIKGLLASGRRSITVCSIVDSRPIPGSNITVAGHEVTVVAAVRSSRQPTSEDAHGLENEALAKVRVALQGHASDADAYSAIARSPGALSLGHFHSENRAWMSAVIAPSAIADPATPIGRLVAERLSFAVRREVAEACPGAALDVRDLAEPTPLTNRVRDLLDDIAPGDGSGTLATVLVDWGALTGETVVRGAMAAAADGPDAVIVAVGVDRAFQGAHHLLRRSSMTLTLPPRGVLPGTADLEERQVLLSFASALKFPRDHRSEVDCPLCATERSLLGARSMPTTLLNTRLRLLRVRTSRDPRRAETVDAFNCGMSPEDVAQFLIWRDILHTGTDDRALAHGVALRLEGRDGGLASLDLVSLARNLVLNPDLLRRRPWSAPRFRHALAEALGNFLMSNDGLAISSSMARQLVTVLRMASKSAFARIAGDLHLHWQSPDVREEVEMAVATMLRSNISGQLLESATSAVSDFESHWDPEDHSTSLGVLKSEIARIRSSRQGDPARRFRWSEAAKLLAALPTHMGVGRAIGRLPHLVAGLGGAGTADRAALIDQTVHLTHEIQRFIEVDFMTVRTLIEDEFEALVQRGAADPFPNQENWLRAVREFEAVITEMRHGSGGPRQDVQRLLDTVYSPLNPATSPKSFASIVLSCEGDLGMAIDAARAHYASDSCILGPFERSARVLFPTRALSDLLGQLVENGLKHRRSKAAPPQLDFELLNTKEDPIHRRLRVTYRGTKASKKPNRRGGLSEEQWGGAIAAFGGRIDIQPAGTADSTFALDLYFQRPWGDSA